MCVSVCVHAHRQIIGYSSMSSNNFEWEPRVIWATHFVSASQHEGKFIINSRDVHKVSVFLSAKEVSETQSTP